MTIVMGMLIFILNNNSLAADFNPHTISKNLDTSHPACLQCHKKTPDLLTGVSSQHTIPDMNNFIHDETRMCTDCHGDNNAGHIVGVSPEYSVPADLPLNHNNQVTCLTCHYTHGELSTDKPMASSSLLDLFFNRERLYKSYILRRNNADGDLCLACHTY